MPDMGEFGSLLPEDAFAGPLVVDVLFDHKGLWLREVSTSFAGEGAAETEQVRFTVTFSDYNASFDISAPAADEVTEEGEFPLFPN